MKKFNILPISAALLALLGAYQIVAAHEAPCPYCKLTLVQNTKDQDNEVVVKMGNKKIEYRCIYCVIKDAGRYKSDLIVYTPSEKVGEPIVLKRTDGNWSAPEGTVFLNAFTKHQDCAALSRAFTSKTAFDSYVTKQNTKDAKAMTLTEFIASVKNPK